MYEDFLDDLTNFIAVSSLSRRRTAWQVVFSKRTVYPKMKIKEVDGKKDDSTCSTLSPVEIFKAIDGFR